MIFLLLVYKCELLLYTNISLILFDINKQTFKMSYTPQSREASEKHGTHSDEAGTFHISPPSFMYVLGRTLFGKTSTIQEMLLLSRFQPMPEYMILQLGDPEDTAIHNKLDSFYKIIKSLNKHGGFQYNSDNVFPVTSIPEGEEILMRLQHANQGESPNTLWLMDDAVPARMSGDISNLVATKVHHYNLYLILVTQHAFLKDAKQTRDNATQLVLIPGFPGEAINRLLTQFTTKEAREHVMQMLSVSGQSVPGDDDDQHGTETFQSAGNVGYRTPVIFDRSVTHPNTIYLYHGLFDNSPEVFPLISKESSTTSLREHARKSLGGGQ